MRALKRVCDKVCSNQQQKAVYHQLGLCIMKERDEGKVISLFEALTGERPLEALLPDIVALLRVPVTHRRSYHCGTEATASVNYIIHNSIFMYLRY